MNANQILSKSYKVSASEPDWDREKLQSWWSPGKQLLKSIRQYQKWGRRGGIFAKFFQKIHTIEHRFWSVVSGADIPLNCQLDGGLRLTHPNGIVIHPDAKIGCNCLILQQVTITKGVEIGGHVDIGAGAKILKQAKIGDHAQIGANAVVVCDIPACAIAVGVPARILPAKQSGSSDPASISQNSVETDSVYCNNQ
ncbi:MAG: serine acetyltransferase [Cyanobacteriota bacterium]|nr:serine acetyltransferase [Cyanobacteriota bacterium]